MRAGVLIAGSLIWDDDALRVAWRNSRLQVDERMRIRVPIRYGRRSSSRSDTYTMLFSSGCIHEGVGTGVGMAVPFKRVPESFCDIVCEATELWRVERRAKAERRGVISAGWGSVGLAVRPDFEDRLELEEFWTRVVKGSPSYGSLAVPEGEQPAVDPQSGVAGFPWNALRGVEAKNDFDILLFTATKASLRDGRYASPQVIAEAWQAAPHEAEYFKRNQAWGITTSQDGEIEALLGSVLDLY